MGKYMDMALTIREKKFREDEESMNAIRDRFLSDVAQAIGKAGFVHYDFTNIAQRPDWWAYGNNTEVLAHWAEEEGFTVERKWWDASSLGAPDLLTIKLR